MRNLISFAVAFCAFQQVALADHTVLRTLCRRMSYETTELERGARLVIGPRPTYRQQYAYEHVMILRRTALNFETVVYYGELDDHNHDLRIRRAYAQLDRDLYYARQTLEDLFYPYDDHTPNSLRTLMSSIERLNMQIRYVLP